MDFRVVIIQIGLVTKKSVPVKATRFLVPSPVRVLSVCEDDSRFLIFIRRIAPNIPVSLRRIGRLARLLKPGVLIRSVVNDQVCYDSYPTRVRRVEKVFEII